MSAYVIRVAGRLSSRLLSAFPTLRARVEPVTTTLTGELPDQAALTGVLNHLDELGVEIVDVVRLPEGEPEATDSVANGSPAAAEPSDRGSC